MVDRLTVERRSWLMSRIPGKNTLPEIAVRKAAHSAGLRFRLHRQDLPGTPDIVFPKLKVAMFVHGCFWHRHPNCSKATPPSSAFWAEKFSKNVARDLRNKAGLRAEGWKVAIIWGCETRDPEKLQRLLLSRLRKRSARSTTKRKKKS